MLPIDQPALKILFSTYWSPTGWKREPSVSPTDFIYAKHLGVMFDPEYLSHDQAVGWAQRAHFLISKQQVVDQFLASLTTRRLDLRSALGSFAVGLNLPLHSWNRASGSARHCPVCQMYERFDLQEDLNVLNFERFKWGGLRHTDPIYIGFDLEQAAKQNPGSSTSMAGCAPRGSGPERCRRQS